MQHILNSVITGENTGQQAEDAATLFLQHQGLLIIDRNFLCKGGEIDIIAQHKKSLVFVEVRFRKSASYGGSAASVSRSKQKKIIHAAQLYLQSHTKYERYTCRFDVIALTPNDLQWMQHAFDAYF